MMSVECDDAHHVDFIVQFAVEQHEAALHTERREPCRFVKRDRFGICCVDPEIDLAQSRH